METSELHFIPHYDRDNATIYCGDNRDVLQTIDAESVDSIVTDPPYGLSFMGKDWDRGVPGQKFWVPALRVAKPGAYLLAFGGTRTFHHLAVAIEDAGWEIRDCVMWVYGSGFPKSHDVSKAIDREAGAEREVVSAGTRSDSGPVMEDQSGGKSYRLNGDASVTAPATEAARQWSGWGTALKPSWEPCIVARKPLIGTVAANVLRYGTGGINVDGCRIAHDEPYKTTSGRKFTSGQQSRDTNDGRNMEQWERSHSGEGIELAASANPSGRWPANLIHDGSPEVLALFPETESGQMKAGTQRKNLNGYAGPMPAETLSDTIGDSGSAARFFYTAKAGSSERRQSKHPTVKPLDLMRYLVRLVTPVGGLCLDPFMGSGTTLEAARLEACRTIGIDLSEQYCNDAVERLRQMMLF